MSVQINAKMVGELRESTGAGLMDCKKALVESEGDFDAAVELLRKKGMATAAKKAGRDASDGLIDTYIHGHINRNDEFDDQSHDDDTKTDHEPEDWVGYLSTAQDGDGFTGLAPENETADESVQEKAAASSFFKALGSSPPVDEDDEPVLVIENEAATKDATGIFSAAAEQVPQNRTSGIDWITVAYFAVAAICFALVIYFYLTSS